MPLILCAACDGQTPYQQSRHQFICTGCGHTLNPSDIDLDGEEVWTVTENGLLSFEDPSPTCPECGSDRIEFKCRQWAVCTEHTCGWAGLEFELVGYTS